MARKKFPFEFQGWSFIRTRFRLPEQKKLDIERFEKPLNVEGNETSAILFKNEEFSLYELESTGKTKWKNTLWLELLIKRLKL